MLYSERLKRAISFAIKTHEIYQKQKRKGKDVPYIVHPLLVGLILSRAHASEDVVIAGVLHDTIEDSVADKRVTAQMLQERFGETVAELVVSVSEDQRLSSWDERKSAARALIDTYSHESILIKSADTIANVTEMLDDIEKQGDAVWKFFAAGKEKTLAHYLQVIEALHVRYPDSPLSHDLVALAERLRGAMHR